MCVRNSIGLIAAAAIACLAGANAASAATLDDYYKTLMTVKTCELEVAEDDMGALQTAIENKVIATGASSETINAIFTGLNNAIGEDVASYCAAEAAAALEVIDAL
jgi:hypothetical protein